MLCEKNINLKALMRKIVISGIDAKSGGLYNTQVSCN